MHACICSSSMPTGTPERRGDAFGSSLRCESAANRRGGRVSVSGRIQEGRRKIWHKISGWSRGNGGALPCEGSHSGFGRHCAPRLLWFDPPPPPPLSLSVSVLLFLSVSVPPCLCVLLRKSVCDRHSRDLRRCGWIA